MAAAASANKNNDDDGRVYEAVAAGKSADEVRRLIAEYGDNEEKRVAAVNKAAGPDNETPLQAAHRLVRGDLVGALVEAGADIAGIVDGHMTPLAMCALYGEADSVRALLRAGGHDPDEEVSYMSDDQERYAAPLHLSVDPSDFLPGTLKSDRNLAGRLQCIEALVREGGAEIDSLNFLGDTPLMRACTRMTNDASMARLLVSLGADVNARNRMEESPVSRASDMCKYETLKILLDHGATTDTFYGDGFTPLASACLVDEDKDYAPDQRRVVFELLRRSSMSTRRMLVSSFPGGEEEIDSAADILVGFKGKIKPWHLDALAEMLAYGVSIKPGHAASVIPPAAARGKELEQELAERRAEPCSWRAHEAMVGLALDAQEAREMEEAVEAAQRRVDALEEELRGLGGGESDEDEDEGDEESGSEGDNAH